MEAVKLCSALTMLLHLHIWDMGSLRGGACVKMDQSNKCTQYVG